MQIVQLNTDVVFGTWFFRWVNTFLGLLVVHVHNRTDKIWAMPPGRLKFIPQVVVVVVVGSLTNPNPIMYSHFPQYCCHVVLGKISQFIICLLWIIVFYVFQSNNKRLCNLKQIHTFLLKISHSHKNSFTIKNFFPKRRENPTMG